MSAQPYDLVGLGIGPFNLSLASLAESLGGLKKAFFDAKPEFQWHPELMLPDATMQTTWVKDLVSAVAPTSPYSFLNYLVENRRFYAFLNTGRSVILRQEFEDYCRWVSRGLSSLNFQSPIREIDFKDQSFQIRLDDRTVQAKHVCLGTGLQVHIPKVAEKYLGPRCFHPKSAHLAELDVTGKRVLIVGGGQTGAEIFLNMLRGRWKQPDRIHWISRRPNLEPLDESAFTNEYFMPHYVKNFHKLPIEEKDHIVRSQKLSSDGITPAYLLELHRELYRHGHVERRGPEVIIQTNRELHDLQQHGDIFQARLCHTVRGETSPLACDIVILCTGFQSRLPGFMEPLLPSLGMDHLGRPLVGENFQMDWDGPASNRLYAVNFSRHGHGIAEPQTSLMAWRSACILNDVLGCDRFPLNNEAQGFLQFFS
ncbi:MAG TPA: SidA/IucD/PvdA family monooxygenase [Oligoflexus sp.]|uniref:lysine N(6)-hydroxylase/L-ornithine N(5)-oxygenase family protein n=1 Tax=Oligoflexus sp. TaxID=1971216 RepID=UPI002D373D8E|nr:SidA/IucD/PvdA family monooxygenase [Oligoflexus sp.]HYX32675.1 SidA/IucD/PvdA family monooxygenase [Oligoflexus sp.]